MSDLTMNHEDLELTVLDLMYRGEDILPIGPWEAPVKRLFMKGEAIQVGRGYRLTDKGKARFEREDAKLPDEWQTQPADFPEWVVQIVGKDPEHLVLLHANHLVPSGYEVLWSVRKTPVVINQPNDPSTALMKGSKEDIDKFLQAMLDTAWERGLRPKEQKKVRI